MVAEATVELPAGWWEDDGTCHRNAVIRPLRGSDEEWLRGLAPATPLAHVATALLARCVRRVGDAPFRRHLIRALAAGDREYLVLRIWELSLGGALDLVLACPRCDARMDARIELADVPVRRAADSRVHAVRADGRTVRFRVPCGDDLEALGPGAGAAELLARCVVDGDGGAAPELLAAVDAELERVAPGPETEIQAVCAECGAEFTTEFDPTAALLAELARRRPQLDRDVHLLSLHYHWSLREILSLARPRRVAYVDGLASGPEPIAMA
jgi:hypothetical protein